MTFLCVFTIHTDKMITNFIKINFTRFICGNEEVIFVIFYQVLLCCYIVFGNICNMQDFVLPAVTARYGLTVLQFPYFFLTKYPEEVIQNCFIVKMGDWIQRTYEHCKMFTTLCSHPCTSLEMIMIFTWLTDKFQIDKSNMSIGGYWLGMNSQKQLGVGLLYPKIK